MALSGQVMFFSTMRLTALTALNWDAIDADRLALVKRIIGEQTGALLRSMAAARAMRQQVQASVEQQSPG